jgi:hypothetical protein
MIDSFPSPKQKTMYPDRSNKLTASLKLDSGLKSASKEELRSKTSVWSQDSKVENKDWRQTPMNESW